MKPEITQNYLKEILFYDDELGDFYWTGVKKQTAKNGLAGHVSKQTGYRLIGIDGYVFLAHRLAWMYVNGEMPTKFVDHIDRDKTNNRIANLRLATMQQNVANSLARSTSQSGVKGVCWDARNGKWRATITINGKQKSLGRHSQIESAISAYQSANKAQNGEFCPS